MISVGLQLEYWERVGPEKRFSHPLRQDWLELYLPDLAAKILDYGCGYGRTLTELTQTNYHNVFGSDFSEAMLRRAQREVSNARLLRNDGKRLPLKSESLDAVLLFAVLTCTPDDDDQRALLAEVGRALRAGGLIYISDLLINDDSRNRERYERDSARFKCYGVFELPEGVVVRHHRKEWIEVLTGSFEQLECEPFTVTTMNGNQSNAFQYLGRKP
jgi:SAM-dependent methyltransferase